MPAQVPATAHRLARTELGDLDDEQERMTVGQDLDRVGQLHDERVSTTRIRDGRGRP